MSRIPCLPARGPAAPPTRGVQAAVRVGILLMGLVLALGSMAHGLPFGGVFFGLLNGGASAEVPYGSTVSMRAVFSAPTGSTSVIKDQDLATTFDPVVSGTPYTTLPLTSSKTFTLTVANPAGDAVTASVAVTVTPISVGVITPASPSVTVGTTQQFNATVGGGIANTLTWFVDNLPGGNGTVGTITSGGLYTAPGTPGSHTIKATSTEDVTQTRSTLVEVVAAPVATSLTASTLTPTSGATFTLTPVYSAGTGTLTYAGGSVTCPATGAESAAITANWIGARTYTLTVTNAAGATSTAAVTVTPVPFAITSFTPNLPLVTYGGAATVSWTLGGSAPTTLTLDGASVLGNLRALVAPRNRQTYTLSGTAGNTDTKTLKVGAQGLDLIAGNPGGVGNLDSTGTAARFYHPYGVAVDGAGNTYVADYYNSAVRKITSAGVVSTLAGPWDLYGAQSVAVDAAGILYVAGSNVIHKSTPEGVVTTLAGQGFVWGWNDGPVADARFSDELTLAVDAVGNVYVADRGNAAIRLISGGTVSTLAPGLSSRGVAVDKDGNVFVAHVVQKVIYKIAMPSREVSIVAGQAGTYGYADGIGTDAKFAGPIGMAVDKDGNVYVADAHAIRKIAMPSRAVTTLAGEVISYGFANGTGAAARFYEPHGVAVDKDRNIYVADNGNDSIRKIAMPSRVVSTLAGSSSTPGSTNGTGTAALFNAPNGVAVDSVGNIYVADSGNHALRKISPAGVVSTRTSAFTTPQGVALDAVGNAYVADNDSHIIHKVILSTGVASTLAGQTGNRGSANGTGTAAQFYGPSGVAVDKDGNIYVADTGNNAIRKIAMPSGEVSTLADSVFSSPSGVAVDQDLNVYVADYDSHTLRKITPGGEVSTLAGLAGTSGSTDGTGTSARFNHPKGVAVDAAGNVYVVDEGNHTLRKVTSAGVVTTVAGRAGLASFQAGPLPGLLSLPQGLALTPDGDLVITMSNGVVQVTAPDAAAPQPSLAASSSSVPRGATFTLTPTFSAGTGVIDQGVGGVSSLEAKTVTADWTGARTFTLTVTYADGTQATAPATVTTQAVSVGAITSANATVTASTPTAFSATVTGGNLGTLTWSSGGVGNWSGSTWTAPASAGGPYTITATSMEDPTQSATTTVTVVAAPAISSFVPGAATITAGSSTTLTGTFTGGTGSVDNSVGAVTTTVATTVTPASTTTYTLTVTNAATVPATITTQATVNVVAAPVATSLVASNTTPTSGATFTLTPVYSAGTGTLTYAGGSVTCPATGAESATITADWTGDRIYTLTVTNAAGATSTATVTVTPAAPFVITAFTPNLPLVSYGGGATLSWALSGSAPTTLTLDGASVLGNLSALVAPRNRQTYTLTGTDGLNTSTQALKVGAQGLDLLAGSPGGNGNIDGTGPAARFYNLAGVALDAAGNTYVVDSWNHTIRKVSPAGVVSTLAGLAGNPGSADGTGTAARFDTPTGVAVDTAGNVYVTDTGNHTIRKITPAGVVSTLAGVAGTSGSTDSTAPPATFYLPYGVAVDAAGNLYVGDSGNHTIRKVSPAGVVSTLAGLAGNWSLTDGSGSVARFKTPQGVAVDAAGNVYVADTNNHAIRKITISAGVGVVSTVAGQTSSGSADGTGAAARFYMPLGVVVDAVGNVYVADTWNSTIRKITSGGVVTTLAGAAGTPGSTDGTSGVPTTARFSDPYGVAVDATGNLYVADTGNGTLRKILLPSGAVSTLAGLAALSGSADGTGLTAKFGGPVGVAMDATGNTYVADTTNHTLRKITPAGVVSTLAGLAGTSGTQDGTTAARFNSPQGVALDTLGNAYVADTSNHTCLLYTSPSPRDGLLSRMPSSA